MDHDAWQLLVGGLVGAWGVVLSWIGKEQVSRIDALEDGKQDGSDSDRRFNEVLARIDQHQTEDRDIHREIAHKLDTVNVHLGETNMRLEGIVGQLKGKGHIA